MMIYHKPKVILIHNRAEMERYMLPFAYSPDRTSVFALAGIRAYCHECGLFQIVSRSDCDLNGGFVCTRCGSFNRDVVIPDSGVSFRFGYEIRTIYNN